MKFFLDTANIAEIEEAASWGVLAGVTTNPTLYAREGGKLADFHGHLKRICDIVDGPVSGETVGLKRDEIVREGIELAAIAPNLVVKVPTMPEGLAATKALSEKGIKVNMTLCFTVPQAILAARSGAAYVSPFVGRFDDISEDGIDQLRAGRHRPRQLRLRPPGRGHRGFDPQRQPRHQSSAHGCRYRHGALRRA